MSESTYRSSGEEESPREARVGALLPATRELLRQGCDQGGVLACERPPAVGRPACWLLATGAAAAGLVASLVGSFGRIDEHRLTEGGSLVGTGAACLAVVVLAALSWRSLRLRSGGLTQGLYLSASSLIEIRGGRVRVWPLSSVVVSGRRSDGVRAEFRGEVLITLTRAKNAALEGSDDGEDALVAERDPLHLEQGRSEAWRPIPEPVPRPRSEDYRVDFVLFVGGILVLAMLLGVATPVGLVRWSDSLGIARAVQHHDTRALASYVKQHGWLSERADDAWFDLLDQNPTARELIAYRISPALRHRDEVHRRLFAQFPVEADHLLARHLLWEFARGHWQEKRPSRVVPPLPGEGEAHLYDSYRAPLDEATRRLEDYLRDGRPEQPLRPQIEQRLFELRVVESRTAICPPPPRRSYLTDDTRRVPHAGEDLLAPYIAQGGERAQEARAARLEQQLAQAITCKNLGDLEKARSLIATPAQRSAFEATWKVFFAERRAGTSLDSTTIEYGHLTPQESTLPSPLAEPLDALWAYLAAHPETRLRGRWSLRGEMKPFDAEENDDGGWGALVRMPMETRERLKRASTLFDFLGCLGSPSFLEWDTRQEGPHLELALVDRPESIPTVILEATLVLPGSPPRTTRLAFIPSPAQAEAYRDRLWGCHRDRN